MKHIIEGSVSFSPDDDETMILDTGTEKIYISPEGCMELAHFLNNWTRRLIAD